MADLETAHSGVSLFWEDCCGLVLLARWLSVVLGVQRGGVGHLEPVRISCAARIFSLQGPRGLSGVGTFVCLGRRLYDLCRRLVIMGLGRMNWFLSLAPFLFFLASRHQPSRRYWGGSLGLSGPCRSQMHKAGHLNLEFRAGDRGAFGGQPREAHPPTSAASGDSPQPRTGSLFFI